MESLYPEGLGLPKFNHVGFGGHPKSACRVTSKPAIEEVVRDVDDVAGQASLQRINNVLSDDKQQQIIALGRFGWPLRRIEQATGCAARRPISN